MTCASITIRDSSFHQLPFIFVIYTVQDQSLQVLLSFQDGHSFLFVILFFTKVSETETTGLAVVCLIQGLGTEGI